MLYVAGDLRRAPAEFENPGAIIILNFINIGVLRLQSTD